MQRKELRDEPNGRMDERWGVDLGGDRPTGGGPAGRRDEQAVQGEIVNSHPVCEENSLGRRDIPMRHRFLIPILLIVIFKFSPYGSQCIFAQDIAPRDTVQGNPSLRDSEDPNRYNLSQFGHETVRWFVQPTKWDGGDWLRLGVIGGATFLTMQADQPIRDAVLRDHGRYYYSAPIDKSTRKIAYEIGQASLYTGAIVLTMKSIVGRARPHDGVGRATYHPFTLIGDDYHSLPGGHTATAFVISTVLSRNVGPTWLKALVYLPAIITPISRTYQDWHWMSDNVLGGAIGYFVATWVVDLHEQKDSRIHVSSLYPLTISVDLE
jgi:membrane-associated phospholipid phosphatase